MYYVNPDGSKKKSKKNKKSKQKGGNAIMAKKNSKPKKEKGRAKKAMSYVKREGSNIMKVILIPAAAVLTGIMATRLVKKHLTSKITALKPALQTVAAAGAVAASFYFLRKYVAYPTMFMAGAAALPLIDYLTVNYPDYFLAADEYPALALPRGEVLVGDDKPELILSGIDASATHLAPASHLS